jgi:hypothetical protein
VDAVYIDDVTARAIENDRWRRTREARRVIGSFSDVALNGKAPPASEGHTYSIYPLGFCLSVSAKARAYLMFLLMFLVCF